MKTPDTLGSTPLRMLSWTLLCALGLAGGLSVGLGLARPIQAVVGMMLVTPITLAMAGSLLGVSQSLVLWRRAGTAARRVTATAVGLALGMTLGIVIVETIGRALTRGAVRLVALSPEARLLGLLAVGATTGLLVGLAQALVSRGRFAHPGRWVAATVVGFGTGLPGGGLAADALLGGLRSPAGFSVFLVVAGLIVGLVTARPALRLGVTRRV